MGWPSEAEKMIRDPVSRAPSRLFTILPGRPASSASELRLMVESHESSNVGRLTGPSPTPQTKPTQSDPRRLSTFEFLIVLAIRAEP